MKRKGGFTLVELLIVIMIIGILAGMVLLSMGPVLDSVRASNVISDTRTVLSAAHMFLVDGMEFPVAGTDDDALVKLMNKDVLKDGKKYDSIAYATVGEARYIGLELGDDYNTAGIKASLKKKAGDIGGVGATAQSANAITNPYTNQKFFLLPLNQAAGGTTTP